MESTLAGFLKTLVGPALMPRLWGDTLQTDQNDPVRLAHTLLGAKGEVSGAAIADRVLHLVEALDDTGIALFFADLRDGFEIDRDAVLDAAQRLRSDDPGALDRFQRVSEPPRQELFRRLNAAPNGTARLVRIRARLLRALRSDPTLAIIDADMRHLLRSWFNRGFLVPRRIGWDSPASLLEKIIAYEAVHAIDSWDDLRRRLQPPDRRCYAFFHPAMPDDPLIFVEVALTRGLAASIQTLLDWPRTPLPETEADTANFYSISNCQDGLAGISFGALLIKQVAADLQRDLPNLRTFTTLSPIPGLVRWLQETGSLPEAQDEAAALPALVAAYLVEAKDPQGRPVDPVARFHLGNGAELHRINLNGDTSATGRARSLGAMVNYRYELDHVESRHEAFAATGDIAVARPVRALLARARQRLK